MNNEHKIIELSIKVEQLTEKIAKVESQANQRNSQVDRIGNRTTALEQQQQEDGRNFKRTESSLKELKVDFQKSQQELKQRMDSLEVNLKPFLMIAWAIAHLPGGLKTWTITIFMILLGLFTGIDISQIKSEPDRSQEQCFIEPAEVEELTSDRLKH